MEPKELKAAIRKEMQLRRDKMQSEEKAILDQKLCDRILSTIVSRKAQVVHTYIPFGSEPDITPLLQHMLDAGYTVICPRSLPKRTIQNLVLSSLTELEEGRFGTKHPAGNNEYTGLVDIYIVPGIAFDKGHYRLGYGSGYYDAWFAAHPGGHKLGICYPFQLIEELPNEVHDVPLSEVIY